MLHQLIELLILILVFWLLYAVLRLDERMKGIRYALDQIGKQVDVPENPVNEELGELLREGKDVEAIRRARETLGLSLREAKQYVDALKQVGS